MTYRRLLIVAFTAIIVIGGGYLALRKPQSTTPSSTSKPSDRNIVGVNEPAPDFNVQTIDGQQFSLAAHKGKPVIVFAMFGGCGECIPVGQTLTQIKKDYAPKGVEIVAVDILKGEPTSSLEQYRNTIQANFPLVSYDEAVVRAYKLTAPEITYVIDRNGNVAFVNQSALSYEQYKQQVEQVL